MLPDELKKRTKTPEQARVSLMRLCAKAEKSSGDALRLMRGWGVSERDREAVLAKLIADRFVDDRRYAELFVREKLRLSGWGAFKIRAALRTKGIVKELIDEALSQTDRVEMAGRLREQLARKARSVRAATPYELRTKLIRYGVSLGYDYEAVFDAVAAYGQSDDESIDFN